MLLALGVAAPAQDGLGLKAAIVFNLMQFVQWPDLAGASPEATPLTLCADPRSALWPFLEPLQARPLAGGRSWPLRSPPASADGARICRAWVAESPPSMATAAAALNQGLPLLVISDLPGQETPGAVVALRHLQERIGFEIDLAAARRGGLQVSSKLLRLAAKVRE